MSESEAAEVLRDRLLDDIDRTIQELEADFPGGSLQATFKEAKKKIVELLLENKRLRKESKELLRDLKEANRGPTPHMSNWNN